jgi:hypothetical protein
MSLIAIKFLMGSLIGAALTALIFRSRFGRKLAIRGVLCAGVAFLLMSGIAGWADSHAAFENGQRMNVAPWGEDLRTRNFIAEHEIVLCVSASVIATVLAMRLSRAKHV